MADGYLTQDLAAMAALAECKQQIERALECGTGIFLRQDGKYAYTAPQSGKNGSINGMVLRLPATAKLTAMAHTHPQEPLAGQNDTSYAFSPEDVKYAKRTGLDMYLGSEKSGDVTKLTPRSTVISRGRKVGETIGTYGDPQTAALVEALRTKPTDKP